jgi:glycosyltransferase involved in cell wall biosynthesis
LAGGPRIRVPRLAWMLQGRGHNVRHGTSSAPIEGRFDIIHVFNSWPLESCVATLFAARKAADRVVFSPIALDLHAYPIFSDLLGAILNVNNPQSIDGDLHEIVQRTPPKSYAAGERPSEGVPGQFETLRIATAIADRVICLSKYERDFLAAIGAHSSHTTIVENTSNFEGFSHVDQQRFARKYGLTNYVLCVGRLESRKNQALLAHAIGGLRRKLVLIGAYADVNYAELIHKYAQRNVVYIGYIEDRGLLASAYAGANTFVVPSWSEGAPLAAMEAGYLGTPLVLSTMSGEREYFGDHADYVHPADISGIQAAVERQSHSSTDQVFRSNLAAFNRERFSSLRHLERTLAVYEMALQAERSYPALIFNDAARITAAKALPRQMQHVTSARKVFGITDEGQAMNEFTWCGRRDGFVPPDGARGPKDAVGPQNGPIVKGHFVARSVAKIHADAKPQYKDYGFLRRVPREASTATVNICVQNLAYLCHGAIKRYLKRRRRAALLTELRNIQFGETFEVQVAVPSFAVPPCSRALLLVTSRPEHVWLAELQSLADRKGVRFEAYLDPNVAGHLSKQDLVWLESLLRLCDVVYIADRPVHDWVEHIRASARLAFEVRTLTDIEDKARTRDE